MNPGNSQPVIMFYGGGWPTNIGNAVIAFGAMALLQSAAPNARVINISGMPRWFFGDRDADKALDVAAITKCDLAVFSGMSHCEEFVRINGPTIFKLRERGVPVLLLGTGGCAYTSEEKKIFSAFLKQVQPIAVIARDQGSYQQCADTVEKTIAGIDCGFFVSMFYEPVGLDFPPFVAVNFDSHDLPKIDSGGREVIYTHHDCWEPIPAKRKIYQNTLISDLPYDYLNIYANAECVYSDRVHACVAALSYGKKAQLFNFTPRGGLFEAMGVGKILKGPVQLDPDFLNAKRTEQIRVTAEIVRDCFAANLNKTKKNDRAKLPAEIFTNQPLKDRLAWLDQIELASQEIEKLVGTKKKFILVDDCQWRDDLSIGSRAIPFLEKDGEYWGAPEDDATAIRECERLRQAGSSFIAFANPAFWWLDCYTGFRDHLRARFSPVLENGRWVVFDMQKPVS